jgi:hypothetical protein
MPHRVSFTVAEGGGGVGGGGSQFKRQQKGWPSLLFLFYETHNTKRQHAVFAIAYYTNNPF